MTRYLFTLLLVLSAAFLEGCTLLGKIDQPKVSLNDVAVKNVTGSGATIVFDLKVDNPNPFPLKVDALDYNLELGGKPFSKGLIDTPTKVEAKQSTVVQVPVPIKYSDLFSSLMDFVGAGSQPYRIYGKAKVSYFNIPFNHTGELKLGR